tara:strand:- start:18641 stop:19294 length:654 start_codon:yes stop_codon:yes gene_type:complete
MTAMMLTPVKIQAEQKTVYINDINYVPMRSGKSNKYRIIHKGLISGTPLTLIESDPETNYSRVSTSTGMEGWIETQYLSETIIAKTQLRDIIATNKSLRRELQTRTANETQLTKMVSQSQQTLKQLKDNNKALESELSQIKKLSANAINLDNNNRKLLQNNEMLKIEIAELQAHNARLADKSDKEWFLRGAFAVFIGAILAIALPRLKIKSRAKEWS